VPTTLKVAGSTLDHTFMMRPHVIAHPINTMKVHGEMSVMIRLFFHGGAMLAEIG
jgi:hypothetical protein